MSCTLLLSPTKVCTAAYLPSDCSNEPAAEENAPCIFNAKSNGVCMAAQDNIDAHSPKGLQCIRCASQGCGRTCYDEPFTGFFLRGVELPCSKLKRYCSEEASAAAGIAITGTNNDTISAVRHVCRASCGLCTEVGIKTIDQLDPWMPPPSTLASTVAPTRTLPPEQVSTTSTSAMPPALMPSGDKTKLGCLCRKEWTVDKSLCPNNDSNQWYSGCGMDHPCDGDTAGGPSWWSWCYTVRLIFYYWPDFCTM